MKAGRMKWKCHIPTGEHNFSRKRLLLLLLLLFITVITTHTYSLLVDDNVVWSSLVFVHVVASVGKDITEFIVYWYFKHFLTYRVFS
jgi:uncharacterized BrkB/YihY/UPF0761 family membrane protein